LVAALIVLVILSVTSIAVGSRSVPLSEVLHILSDSHASGVSAEAVRLRIPRMVLGILVGIALATAGTLLQGMTRNPLADPSILGLNSGAAFAIVLSMATIGLSAPIQYVWVGMLGSCLAAGFVWILGSLGAKGATPLKMTLAGAVVSAMLSSLTSAILLPRIDVISSYRFWQVGGLSGARFSLMMPILPILAVGLILAICCLPGLNALAMGDDMARGLGSRVRLVRVAAWISAVMLSASATALAGPIAFVGLVVPHAARLLVGSDYRRILGLSVILGPVLLVASDTLGRVLTRPTDVEVGIITALIGAPCFIVLVRRRKLQQI
jgi:iron complex transport system permease protein